ncbi:MAG: sulfurtransferase [Acidimicrobiaceae bacterium]|nr:sulfurtransferase [Acidimicrobiaceae bacterium]MDB4103364.1 sulfurtransferase [Acidimicrobiales bacterium]
MEDFGPLVSAEWLADNLDAVKLFDSRSYLDGRSAPDAFVEGHLPGAVFVSLDDDLSAPPSQPGGRHPFPTPAAFATAMGRLGYAGAKPAVIYDDVGGGMAARLWFMLTLLDIPAAILDGGMHAWHGELESGAVTATPAVFDEDPWPTDRLISADQIAARIEADGVVIDARNSSRYVGKPNRIDPRFGHVPGAINLAWEDNIDDLTGLMLSVDDLRHRYAEVLEGSETGQRPAAYCGSGVTACHDLLALTMLGVEADLYVGSWSEWGADETRPVESDVVDD